jgi:ABC-type dipeptide/oligopeptide/nickel transport system permease component
MKWLVGRLLSAAVSIWLAGSLAFFALRLLPGDAIESQLLQTGASPALIAERRARQGLDGPLFVQYGQFWLQIGQGSLGYSLLDGQPVTEMIAQRLAPTATLALASLTVGVTLGLLLGLAGALKTPCAPVARLLTNLSLSAPIYWTGTLAIWFFAVTLGWLPSAGGDEVSQLNLPAAVHSFNTARGIYRVVEAGVRDTVAADFVRTARAKGLPEALILRRHVLRMALLPVFTVIALQTGFLFGGTVITESLFVRPGVGRLLLDSTLQQDYPVVQGLTLFLAALYILLNLGADILYAALDPRITLS